MSASARIERSLETALCSVDGPGCPPQLYAAMRHAVFPRGARIRPRLTLAAAAACGDDDPQLVDAAAAAIEMLHCASLVHDDLPCFDDADIRRGRPSVHRRFDEREAVLAGDGLIVLSFQTVAAAATVRPTRLAAVIGILAGAVGGPSGIIAGQAWECEPAADLDVYHKQKTGALFAGAAMVGAAACGATPEPWRALGETLGQAYQAADDIGDAGSDLVTLGKPVGRDAHFGRPNLVTQLGMAGALRRFDDLVAATVDAIPDCAGRAEFTALVVSESRRLLPQHLAQHAA